MQRWTAGGILWFICASEAMLHAAEADRICEDGPDTWHGEIIGWVSSQSQPYDNRYVLLSYFMQDCSPCRCHVVCCLSSMHCTTWRVKCVSELYLGIAPRVLASTNFMFGATT